MTTETINATSRAIELAGELGVELSEVKGTGPEDRIGVDDVRKAAATVPDDVLAAYQRPILAPGSGGPDVLVLGQLLGQAGYETSFTNGENPFNLLDPSVLQAVKRFRADLKVEESAETFNGDQRMADDCVGPETWAALIRATR